MVLCQNVHVAPFHNVGCIRQFHNVGCTRHSPNKFGTALICTPFQVNLIALICTTFQGHICNNVHFDTAP